MAMSKWLDGGCFRHDHVEIGGQMNIKELVALSGQPARQVRHLISRGILREPTGTTRGATYDEEHLRVLALYTELRAAGVTSLDVIREKVAAGHPPSATTTLNPWPGVEVRVESAALGGIDMDAVIESIRKSLEAAVRNTEESA
jgi:DNA-binding transcriptional MerR regulator